VVFSGRFDADGRRGPIAMIVDDGAKVDRNVGRSSGVQRERQTARSAGPNRRTVDASDDALHGMRTECGFPHVVQAPFVFVGRSSKSDAVTYSGAAGA
jgi:hypothetical protein